MSRWKPNVETYIFQVIPGSRGGDRGSGPPPWIITKLLGSLAILARLPWKITKLPSQHSLLRHHLPAKETSASGLYFNLNRLCPNLNFLGKFRETPWNQTTDVHRGSTLIARLITWFSFIQIFKKHYVSKQWSLVRRKKDARLIWVKDTKGNVSNFTQSKLFHVFYRLWLYVLNYARRYIYGISILSHLRSEI